MGDSKKSGYVTSYIFLNKKTGGFAALCSREGWI
jgi:hypothetical protein